MDQFCKVVAFAPQSPNFLPPLSASFLLYGLLTLYIWALTCRKGEVLEVYSCSWALQMSL